MENNANMTVIKLDQEIKHKTLGVGNIVGVEKAGGVLMISVRFKGEERVRKLVYPHPAIEIVGKGANAPAQPARPLPKQQTTCTAHTAPRGEKIIGEDAKTSPAATSDIWKKVSPTPTSSIKPSIYGEIEKARKPYWMHRHLFGDLENEEKLVVGQCYGTNAQKIFLSCCDVFGWDASEKGKFGMMQPLYAEAAAHGKSPWFLLHHSWIEKPEKKFESNWWNTITEKTVYEEWRETTSVFYHDFTDRVTFAKGKNGYIYIGVFRSSKEDLFHEIDPITGDIMHIKRYHLVQEDYEV